LLFVSSGVFVLTIQILFNTLCTCVSTAKNGAFFVTDKKTLAVFIHIQGRVSNSSIVSGISELYLLYKMLDVLYIYLALLL
jgi:hypothetical protein